ncbi:bile acid:sodium symporter family protein [Marinobacter halodurans]|uniref:Bile acid:sodium symporter family protein n=1 Tax=Marinobacter halodurans TaxID=2528979 RepID=A0ABY1ZRF5_9GAMM|nr:bile acid:sodium symporter family protein [Marinobacter halodurans]TBW58434.1 bile acid:sodium symporter family protein [Marinobacter halodurans]
MSAFERINRLFPVWAILFAAIAAWQPAWFTDFAFLIKLLLGVIMFAMGLTLSRHDFMGVVRAPLPVGVGVLLQFTVMPLAALFVSWFLQLSPELTIGMVLVGATAGGTASNVITWLANGHVALSVSMTLTSTIISVVATPLLTALLVGQTVDVPVASMFLSIAQLVIGPIAAGVIIHHVLGRRIKQVEPALATLAMAAIVFIIAIVVALNAGRLSTLGPLVIVAVVLHNMIGLAGGYAAGRALGFSQRVARTMAIEVGMQNSGLAVALANQFFTATAALPGALFSIWHNVSGSLLAGYWKRRPTEDAGRSIAADTSA